MIVICINVLDFYCDIVISNYSLRNMLSLMQKYFTQIWDSKLYNTTMYTIIWRFKTGTAIIIMASGIEVFLKFGEEKN